MSLRVRSFLTLIRIAIQVGFAHLFGRRIAPDWDASMEIGIRFWRTQFTTAMRMKDIARGRALFDSLLTETDDAYPVTVVSTENPRGLWIIPKQVKTDITVLYLHGGGYTFNGPISKRFAAMLAHHCRARLFMPLYRLTPEHPHPAQADDAFAAWQYLCTTTQPEKIAIAGDSAGAHMALMHLQALKAKNLAQPCSCIAICPWTDIGERGESLKSNDQYDLAQGWMALKFGEWLDPDGRFGRAALSPITHDFTGLAPIYIQAGGREVLRDMILEFGKQQSGQGADIMLDLWPDMPHNFPAYDSTKPSSSEALERLGQLIQSVTENTLPPLPSVSVTRFASGVFDPQFEKSR